MEGASDIVDKVLAENDLDSLTRQEFLSQITQYLGSEIVEQNQQALVDLMGARVQARVAAEPQLADVLEKARSLAAGEEDVMRLLKEEYGDALVERHKEQVEQVVEERREHVRAQANAGEAIMKRALEIAKTQSKVNARSVLRELQEEFGEEAVKEQKREIRKRLSAFKEGDDVVLETRKRTRTDTAGQPKKKKVAEDEMALFFTQQPELENNLFGTGEAAEGDPLESFFAGIEEQQGSEDEYVEAPKKRKKKKKKHKKSKKKSSSSSAPKKKREKSPEMPKSYSEVVFKETADHMRKQVNRKALTVPRDELINEVSETIERMTAAFDEDLRSSRVGQPATARLKLLPWAISKMNREYLLVPLIENDLLGIIARWLAPLPNGTLPSHRVRTDLLQALMNMRVDWSSYLHKLRSSQLGKVVNYLSKHDDELNANKILAGRLLQEWSRPVFGLSDNYKDLSQVSMKPDQQSTVLDESRKRLVEQAQQHKERTIRRKTKGSQVARARIPMPESRSVVNRPQQVASQSGRKSKGALVNVRDAESRFLKDLKSRK